MKNIDVAKLALQKMHAADEAVAVVSFNETREFTIDAGEFNLLRTLFDKSISLSAIKDHKKGSVSQNDVSEEGIDEAVQNLFASLEASEPDEAWAFSKEPLSIEKEKGDLEPDLERLFARSEELLNDIKEQYPKILVEQLVVKHVKSDGVYLNKAGVECKTHSGRYSASLMFSGHEGEKSSSFNGAGFVAENLDKRFIDIGSLRLALANAEKQIETVTGTEKFEGAVVLTPDCAADIISSLLDNYVGDSVILNGTSQWKDKLGEKVMDERITVSMNATSDEIVSGQTITGEGFLAKDFDVIKDGVLNSFMLSNYVANKTGRERAKNDGAGMMVKPGDTSIDTIIKGIKKGLYIGRISGGNPGVSGEFSAVAKNAFFIENGELKDAVSETMISGNLAVMFNRLIAISKETFNDGGSVMPFMAFDGITISGK